MQPQSAPEPAPEDVTPEDGAGNETARSEGEARVPVEVKSQGDGSGQVAPLEGIEAAMKMQAEILKRMHDRQEEMSSALADSRRSEMMIQSTRALNDSFSGMQRVQQGLMDRLGEDASRRRFGLALLVVGVVAIAGAVIWGVRTLGHQVEKTGRELAAREPREDPAAKAALGHVADLRDRLKSMESRDQAMFLDRLDKLRDRIQELEAVRLRLESERDKALAAVDAEAADVLRLEERIETLSEDLAASRKEGARLTAKAMADQQLIRQLNDVIEAFKPGAGTPVSVNDGGSPESNSGVTTDPSRSATANASGDEGAPDPTRIVEPGKPVAARPVTPEMLHEINALLKQTRSSDVYEITSATSFDGDGLQDIVLEVRGRNGSLAKVVRAEKLAFTMAASGTLMELDFQVGHVEFRHGVSRIVKSPFFNDRYEIVVLGVSRDDWVAAGFPFLKVK